MLAFINSWTQQGHLSSINTSMMERLTQWLNQWQTIQRTETKQTIPLILQTKLYSSKTKNLKSRSYHLSWTSLHLLLVLKASNFLQTSLRIIREARDSKRPTATTPISLAAVVVSIRLTKMVLPASSTPQMKKATIDLPSTRLKSSLSCKTSLWKRKN